VNVGRKQRLSKKPPQQQYPAAAKRKFERMPPKAGIAARCMEFAHEKRKLGPKGGNAARDKSNRQRPSTGDFIGSRENGRGAAETARGPFSLRGHIESGREEESITITIWHSNSLESSF